MAKNKTLELSIKIAGKMDKSLTAALASSQGQLGSFAKSISNIGTAGLAAMGALTAGTVATIARCTKEAAKFENYMSDVVKVVDGMADATGKVSNKMAENGRTYAENYAILEERLKDLSTQIPYTFEDLTRLAAAAGQSGKTFEDLTQTDFLKDIAMWGTAMDISADQAGDWGAKWEQAFNMNHEQVMEVADVINYLGNNYATTAAEIAQSVNDAASMGQLAGVDVKATAAIAASMQAMGVSTDRVGTSIKRIYTNITKGSTATAAQEAAFERLGFSATQIAKSMQTDGTGTLLKVFEAVNNLPDAEKLSTLNALFGQWAIEGGAKLTQNLGLLTGMLKEVSDASVWSGSMEKEFIIKATTPEAIETMLGSAKSALMDDIGTAFLPAYKEFGLSMIGFIRGVRENMPELTKLAESLGKLASRGVEKLGTAMNWALPYIQKGLDYLLNNGEQVAHIIGILAATFAGMKLAPAAEGCFPAWAVCCSCRRWRSGAAACSAVSKPVWCWSEYAGQGSKNASALWNGALLGQQIAGSRTIGVGAVLQNWGGLFSGRKKTAASANRSVFETVSNAAQSGLTATGWLKNAVMNSGPGKYASSVFAGIKGQRTAGARFFGSLGAGAKTLFGSLGGGKGKGLMGLTGLMSFNDAVFGSTLSGGAAIKNILGSGGGLLKSSGKLMGSIWGPIAGGFGTLLSGALPVVGVVSSIIAVVSLLGDNLEYIREIVGGVFGEQGLAIFDKFTGALSNVGNFISGLFVDGGVASALSGFREMLFGQGGIFAGDETAAGAFDGIVQMLQSVMGIVGQVVTFANTTVKPIIEGIFNFITQTVVPVILQTIQTAAPYISSIISGIGSAVMTVAQIIGQAIQFVMPVIRTLATILLNIGQVVVPSVLAAIAVFSEGISNAITGVKTIFEGVITFITGVFSGNWRQAWEGVRSIFTGIFDTLGALFKAPINAVITLINKAIAGINGLNITIPDWVPGLGGKTFGLNIPEIPMLARGGFTNGASIAGEAGTEAVISFQRAVRRENLATWAKAGELLGVRPVELADIPAEGGFGGGGITFAPQITIQGNADRSVIDEALAEAQARFEAWYLQMQRRNARTAY
ncbi:MAG: phage tail tape measure protein [Dysosmobacter sp.]